MSLFVGEKGAVSVRSGVFSLKRTCFGFHGTSLVAIKPLRTPCGAIDSLRAEQRAVRKSVLSIFAPLIFRIVVLGIKIMERP